MGIDPGPLTLRQLNWMAEARQEVDWDYSNSVLAAVVNGSRGICNQLIASHGGKPKKTDRVDPVKINPFRQD